jgi:hypothetical protein
MPRADMGEEEAAAAELMPEGVGARSIDIIKARLINLGKWLG